MIKSKENSESYIWGNDCQAWYLVNSNELSVIQETMPPKAAEQLHFHKTTQQFFYVLNGEATFTIGKQKTNVRSGNGIHIQKGQAHKVKNNSSNDLEMLVISQPHSHLDRTNIDE